MGVFLVSVSFELAGRPGSVQEKIVEVLKEWTRTISLAVAEAQSQDHLDSEADRKLIAFHVNLLLVGICWAFRVSGKRDVLDRTRSALLGLLERFAGPKVSKESLRDVRTFRAFLKEIS